MNDEHPRNRSSESLEGKNRRGQERERKAMEPLDNKTFKSGWLTGYEAYEDMPGLSVENAWAVWTNTIEDFVKKMKEEEKLMDKYYDEQETKKMNDEHPRNRSSESL